METNADIRIGDLISQSTTAPQLVMLGFTCDEGVARNSGRIGAAKAPDIIRKEFSKMTPCPNVYQHFANIMSHTTDLGDIDIDGLSMEDAQAVLGETITPYLEQGTRVIILGGGHETSFGHFLGYVQAKLPVRILNWDAHADVRPLKNGKGHSGSPFRQALEHPSEICKGYSVAGLQPHSVARTHLQYVRENEGRYFFKHSTDRQRIRDQYRYRHDRSMVTFDIDAVDETCAPGVSAPAADGLKKEYWLYANYMAGYNEHITSYDIVEVNPEKDIDNRTSRLAALSIWYFIKGWSDRLSAIPALF